MEYFDLRLNLNLEDDLDIYLGINNLLDRDPPINGDIGYVWKCKYFSIFL